MVTIIQYDQIPMAIFCRVILISMEHKIEITAVL